MSSRFGFFALLALLTCSDSIPRYYVAVRNATSAPLQDAHISYGEFVTIGGPLAPRAHAREGYVPYPIPDRAKVQWRTSDGVEHSKEVDVKPVVPERFSGGSIFFEIRDGDQVVVTFQP